MDILYKIFADFWKKAEVNDNKLHASQILPKGIKELCDIPYTDTNSKYHLLDVYYPEETKKPLPVIIDIHGGGWMYATKDLNKIYCQYLAKRGFVVFNMSYRLVPSVTVKKQLQDISKALVKIKELMNTLPCLKSKVMLTGDSAGGQLASYTAAISKSKELRDYFETEDHKINFSCLTLTSPVAYMNDSLPMSIYCKMMWGEKPFKKCLKKYMNVNELLRETKSYPPTLLVTSSGDILGLKQTRKLFREMLENSIDAVLLDFPKFNGTNLQHVFGVLEPYSEAGTVYIDKMCEFFRKYI